MRKFVLAAIFLVTCPSLVAQHSLNNDAIIKLLKAGLSDDVIVTIINGSPGIYDTSVDGVIALKTGGAGDKVLAAILTKANAPAPIAATSVAPAAPVAADPNDPTSPHEPGLYLMVNGSDGKQKMVRIEQTESNTGFSRMMISIEARIAGPHAVLRTSESKPVFYLYFPSSSSITDAPSPSQFSLLILDVKKDHRETEIGRRGVTPGGGSYTITEFNKSRVIESSAEKVRPTIFKVTPDTDLHPGEYAFIATMKLNETGVASFFDFGVDAK